MLEMLTVLTLMIDIKAIRIFLVLFLNSSCDLSRDVGYRFSLLDRT